MLTFVEPKTIDEAKGRWVLLVQETQTIEAQLADTSKMDQKPKDGQLYGVWRGKAISAMNIKRAEQRYLKEWIKKEEEDEFKKRQSRIQGDPCTVLLSQLHLLVLCWIDQDRINLSDSSEEGLIHDVEVYLRTI